MSTKWMSGLKVLLAAALFSGCALATDPTGSDSVNSGGISQSSVVLPGSASSSSSVLIGLTNVDTSDYNPGPSWTLTWTDEFTAATINRNIWSNQILYAGYFNNEWQAYNNDSANSYISNGNLIIKAVYNGNGLASGNFTSARIVTFGKKHFKYGRIAAKMRLPYGQGIWPAFWMLGTNITEVGGNTPWPDCGEIDIMEFRGQNVNDIIGTLHGPGYSGGGGITATKTTTFDYSADYHIYEIEWTNNSIKWYLDGTNFHTVTSGQVGTWVFNKDFYIILNLAVGGGFLGYPDGTTVFPQYLAVDWVRYWQYSGNGSSSSSSSSTSSSSSSSSSSGTATDLVIPNGDFSDTSAIVAGGESITGNWHLYSATGVIAASCANNVMTVNVTTASGTSYDPKITSGLIPNWVVGANYNLEFWAKSSTGTHNIPVKVGHSTDGAPYWYAINDSNVASIGTTWTKYTYNIACINNGYTDNGVVFEFGSATSPVTFSISNVTLKGL